MDKNNSLATAEWKDGPLSYNKNWMRRTNGKVALKYISQNNIDELLNKVWIFFIIKYINIY